MYSPKYIITNKILQNIGAIEACREVVNNAPLIPSYEKQFQEEAALSSVHHGTHIEGNELSFTQAEGVLGGKEIVAGERDIQEVINYRNVLKYLDQTLSEDQKKDDKHFSYSEKQLLKIHSFAVEKLVPEEQRGKYRKVQVILRNAQTGEVVFRPPPAPEVPYLMEDFFKWLNSSEGREVHPVLRSAIAHYVISSVHPFTDGDGRTARGFATLILFAEGYDIKKLFSLEEYFDKNAFEYYDSLRKTDLTNESSFEDRDLTGWVEFFTKALAIELTRVKDKIRRVSLDGKIKEKLGGKQLSLNERQMAIMEYIESRGEAAMRELKPLLPNISEDTILREIYSLMKQKLIKKKGSRKAAKYAIR
ncbi:Fic family protein [Candidatus Microgenomates bacterium]|jgi:Fic family protein|nr:MAG: Fic family protein [Candidatus Microgenomates bacterium]